MALGAIQAVIGGSILLVGLVVWLACRLKQKNRQLRKTLTELQRRNEEAQATAQPESTPIYSPAKPSLIKPNHSGPAPFADAFLWGHLSDTFLWNYVSSDKQDPLTSNGSSILPRGIHDRAALESLLDSDVPFTGFVVLIGITNGRPRLDHPAEPYIEELLGPADFACRNSNDELLVVCPGLRGAEAQRRLNEISERLWSFQLRGQGSFSILFSWGGIGSDNRPLSDAIASASERMQQTKRSRVLLFRRKAG
jgi:hypothetical protein